jgi:hypothetical protein
MAQFCGRSKTWKKNGPSGELGCRGFRQATLSLVHWGMIPPGPHFSWPVGIERS